MRQWVAAVLVTLSVAGCAAREGVTQAAGDYDEGTACMNASGNCYLGTVRSLCVTTGPAGCDQDPSAPNALFCCIQFSGMGLYSGETADANAATSEAGVPTTEAGAPTTEAGAVVTGGGGATPQ
jgi:hypothetical protein